MSDITINEITEADRGRIKQCILGRWKTERMVSKGRLYQPGDHKGFIAQADGEIKGLITYEKLVRDIEITLLQRDIPSLGIAARLTELVIKKAKEEGVRRVWAVTTNDNTPAMHFYQKNGFDMVQLHYNALLKSRQLKPEIPATGFADIPIKHELEFEIRL